MGFRTANEVINGSLGRLSGALIPVIFSAEARAVYVHMEDRETLVGPKGILYEVRRFADPAGDWAVIYLRMNASVDSGRQ